MIRTSPFSLLRLCAAVATVPLLSGCVAAVAVPLMTVVGAATERKRTREEVVADLPAANAATLATPPAPGTSVQLTGLTALPPPSGGDAAERRPWESFATYALERATALAGKGDAVSALLTADSATTFRTELRPCLAREPAVVIDLDPRDAAFAPETAGTALPAVSAAAARLREAGVIVLWVSQTSANEVAAVAEALQSSGLDPTGRDPILLVRNDEERKQVLREEANQTVCVVAMAGDERSDFDELFDYLRDPTLASMYDGQLGAGWFLAPGPFTPAPSEPALSVAPASEDGGG